MSKLIETDIRFDYDAKKIRTFFTGERELIERYSFLDAYADETMFRALLYSTKANYLLTADIYDYIQKNPEFTQEELISFQSNNEHWLSIQDFMRPITLLEEFSFAKYTESIKDNPKKLYDDVKQLLDKISFALVLRVFTPVLDHTDEEYARKIYEDYKNIVHGYLTSLIVYEFDRALKEYKLSVDKIEKLIDKKTEYLYSELPNYEEFLALSLKACDECKVAQNDLLKRFGLDDVETQEEQKNKRKNKSKNKLKDFDTQELPIDLQKIYSLLPTSAQTDLIYDMFNNSGNIEVYGLRKNAMSHARPIEVKQGSNAYKVIYTTKSETFAVSIEDIENKISNKPTKKMMQLALIKINEQAYNRDNELYRNYISFNINELLEKELYTTLPSARKGFNSACSSLMSIKLEQHDDSQNYKARGEVLFTGYNIDNNICTININERINWKALLPYYTLLPNYYFKLSNKASDLSYYISYLARQNINSIVDNGYFTISLRAIQNKLNLKNERETKDVQRDIKNPILNAIDEINKNDDKKSINIELHVKKNVSSSEYLDTGYLKIFVYGEFADYFKKLYVSKTNKIEKAERRKRNIEDRAKSLQLAKQIENNNKQ